MSGYRYEIDAVAGPAIERVVGGSLVLVRVRLFNGPGVVDALTDEPSHLEDVCTDLRPQEARELALALLSCAQEAERITQQTDGCSQR